MNQNVYNAFRREFEILLDCLAGTIRAISDEDWVSGDSLRHTPAHQACHCLVPIVRYLQVDVGTAVIGFRFKIPSEYPSRGHVLDIIAATRPGTGSYVADVVDQTLVDKAQRFPPMFKMIYLLRHSVTHLAYLRDELRRRGYRLPKHTKSYRPKT